MRSDQNRETHPGSSLNPQRGKSQERRMILSCRYNGRRSPAAAHVSRGRRVQRRVRHLTSCSCGPRNAEESQRS